MNKLTMKMRLLAAFLLLGLWGATAQTAREQIAAMPERAGGIYHSYEYLPGPAVPAPKGYVPFYISHYGRHGSRWHTSEKIYAEPLGILRKADSAGVLTPKGATCWLRSRSSQPMPGIVTATSRPAAWRNTGASPNACIRPIPRSFRPGTAANALSKAVRRSCRAAS